VKKIFFGMKKVIVVRGTARSSGVTDCPAHDIIPEKCCFKFPFLHETLFAAATKRITAPWYKVFIWWTKEVLYISLTFVEAES
jgi:hypothetical protein